MSEQRSAELAREFDALAPWIYRFEINGASYGGAISAAEDERIPQFFEFAPEAARILELGALEGAQSIRLAENAHVQEIVALEGRAANIRKAELIKRLLGLEKVRFVEANLESADLASFGRFDAIFCSGLLYHLPEPWRLVEQLPRLAPKLFIWTHYADDLAANVNQHGFRGLVHREGGKDEPLSGLSETAFWPTIGSLLTMLTTSGYRRMEVIKHDGTHRSAPAITIAARVS